MSNPLAKPHHTRLKFILFDESLGIAINEACDALPQFADLVLQGPPLLTLPLTTDLLATLKFLPQSLGLPEQGTDFMPHGQFQTICAHLCIRTDALAAKAIGIRP